MTCANSLAGTLHEAERYEEALPLLREVLEALRAQLGDKHPDTLTSANNLAGLYYSLGDYQEAEALFREVLNGRRTQLGDWHPETVQTANHLAASQQAQRHLVEEPNKSS